MRQVDALLTDRELVQIVYEALARRWPQSRTRGRPATPAEVVLRLLCSSACVTGATGVLEREVRANLVYRQFTRVGADEGSRCARPSVGSPWRSAPRSSSRSIVGSSLSPVRGASFGVGGCGWIRRSWRPTFTTRPIAPCSAMGYGYSPAP